MTSSVDAQLLPWTLASISIFGLFENGNNKKVSLIFRSLFNALLPPHKLLFSSVEASLEFTSRYPRALSMNALSLFFSDLFLNFRHFVATLWCAI